jgi:hypothetical protein
MLNIEGNEGLPLDEFRGRIVAPGEMQHYVSERQRFENRAVAPGPHNDVIAATGFAIWTKKVIAALKVGRKEDRRS